MVSAATFWGWAICIAAADLRRRRIPNALIAVGCAVAVAHGWLAAPGIVEAAKASALGVGVAAILTLPGYALRRLGGGDVKLAAVIGLWLGAEVVLAGALVAAALSVLWYWLAPGADGAAPGRVEAALRLPYGAFMAAGAGLAVVAGFAA